MKFFSIMVKQLRKFVLIYYCYFFILFIIILLSKTEDVSTPWEGSVYAIIYEDQVRLSGTT